MISCCQNYLSLLLSPAAITPGALIHTAHCSQDDLPFSSEDSRACEVHKLIPNHRCATTAAEGHEGQQNPQCDAESGSDIPSHWLGRMEGGESCPAWSEESCGCSILAGLGLPGARMGHLESRRDQSSAKETGASAA